jgi:hypothetical protein
MLDLHIEGSKRHRPRGRVEANEGVDLIDRSDESFLNQHGRGNALGLDRVDAEQLSELDEGDVVVQARSGLTEYRGRRVVA